MIKKNLLVISIAGIITCSLGVLSCTANVGGTTKKNSVRDYTRDTVYQNVAYSFVYEKHCYSVYTENKTYDVPATNYFLVEIYEWQTTENHEILQNEYFVNANELFVYVRK